MRKGCTLHVAIGRAHLPEKEQHDGDEITCVLRLLGERNLISSDYGEDKSVAPVRTTVVKSSRPSWDQWFQFNIDNEDLASKQLEVCLWIKSKSGQGPQSASSSWRWRGQILVNVVKLTSVPAFNKEVEHELYFLMPSADGSAFEDTGISLTVQLRLQGERADIVPISRVHFSGVSPGYEGEEDEKAEAEAPAPSAGERQEKQVGVVSRKLSGLGQARWQSYINAASKLPLLQDAPPHLISAICRNMQAFWVRPGEVIVEERGEGESLFFVVRGACKVLVGGEQVSRLQDGDYFGEVALILAERWMATVVAVTECEILELSRTSLFRLLGEHRESAQSIYVALRSSLLCRVDSWKLKTLETHPAIVERCFSDPLASLKNRERLERIMKWHQNYDQAASSSTCTARQEEEQNKSKDHPGKCGGLSEWLGEHSQGAETETSEDAVVSNAMKKVGCDKRVWSTLQRLEMFQGADARCLAELVTRLVEVKLARGDKLDAAELRSLYLFSSGHCKVESTQGDVVEWKEDEGIVGEVAGFSAPVRKVVCLGECKFFELTENVIGTVFNMYPHVYKDLASDVKEKLQLRVEGKSTSASTKRKLKLRFRASTGVDDRSTPEAWSVTSRTVHRLALHDLILSQKIDMSTEHRDLVFTIDYDGQQLLTSSQPPQSQTHSNVSSMFHGRVIRWAGCTEIPMEIDNGDHVVRLTIYKHRSFRRDHFMGSAEVSLRGIVKESSPVHTSRLLTLPLLDKPSRQGGGNVNDWGTISFTLTTDLVRKYPYRLRVPSVELSQDRSVVVDHTGKETMELRWRTFPMEMGMKDSDSFTWVESHVDLMDAEGTCHGQVVTWLTSNSHVKARMITREGDHWGTFFLFACQVNELAKGSLLQQLRWKIVTSFDSLQIGLSSTGKNATSLFVNLVRVGPGQDKPGAAHSIGRVKLDCDVEKEHTSIEVEQGEDMVKVVQCAVAIREARRLVPKFHKRLVGDPALTLGKFEENYLTAQGDDGGPRRRRFYTR